VRSSASGMRSRISSIGGTLCWSPVTPLQRTVVPRTGLAVFAGRLGRVGRSEQRARTCGRLWAHVRDQGARETRAPSNHPDADAQHARRQGASVVAPAAAVVSPRRSGHSVSELPDTLGSAATAQRLRRRASL
jgi:hypothetical protein